MWTTTVTDWLRVRIFRTSRDVLLHAASDYSPVT